MQFPYTEGEKFVLVSDLGIEVEEVECDCGTGPAIQLTISFSSPYHKRYPVIVVLDLLQLTDFYLATLFSKGT